MYITVTYIFLLSKISLNIYLYLILFILIVFYIFVSMHYGGRTVRHMGTRSGINRDSPDGFPRLPTMAAQRAYQHKSGPKSVR